MFDHLEEVEIRFDNLGVSLTDPNVISRQEEFQKISKEYSDLKDLVEAYREYKKVAKNLSESEELVRSADADFIEMARQDVLDLEAQKAVLEKQIKFLLLPKDPNDAKNVLLEIRAGTGGDEAALFAAELLRVYLRFSETLGWKTDVLSKSDTGLGGIREVVLLVEGKNVYSRLKYEGGVHRVQRVPATENAGRVHTSAVTVAVLPEAEEVEIKINDKDIRVDVMRAGGPGGQSVNTTDSAVRVTHIPTGLVVFCQDEKSQHKNKAKAMRVLRARMLEAEQDKQNKEVSSARKEMVGTGDRSERIRTYNFPQNRVTDHRIGLTLHNLDRVMEGDIEGLFEALQTYFQAEMLKNAAIHSR